MTIRTTARSRAALLSLLVFAAAAGLGCARTPQQKEAKFLESGKRHRAKKDYVRAVLQFRNAVSVMPKDPEPYYQLGLTYLDAGSAQMGAAALAKAAELDPKHAGAQVKLAELMASSREKAVIADGERRMRELLKTEPQNVDALTTLAMAESALGEPGRAEQHLRQALQQMPQSLKSSVALARIKLEQKDFAGAEEVLRNAVKLAPQSTDAAVALANLYLLTKKWPQAQEQFRTTLRIDPGNAPGLLGLAATQMQLGQSDDAEQTYRKVSALPDRRYKSLHAFFLLKTGKLDAALAEFEQLVKADPKDRTARTDLMRVYLMANRFSDAERLVNTALKANPKDVDALLQRSAILLQAGKDKEAQEDVVNALRYRPTSPEAYYLMSRVYQARGETLLQRQQLGEAVRRNPGLLSARIELAQNLIEAHSARAALDILDEAPQAQKGDRSWITERNWALWDLADESALSKGVGQGLALGRTPELSVQEALLKTRKKDYSGARSVLEQVLKQEPENVRALRALAYLYAEQNQPEKAIERLRQLASERPKSAIIQLLLGQWLQGNGDRGGARAAFTAAKAANPKMVKADLSLASLDLLDGNFASARHTLTAIASSNREGIEALLLLGSLDMRANNYESAIDDYRRVLDKEPTNIMALNNIAYLLAEHARKPDEALKYAQQARELAPNDADIQGTLGWIFYDKGLYSTAIQQLADAVAKDGGRSGANPAIRRYHLAMAYLKSGDRLRGRQTLNEALKMDPQRPEAKMAQELLAATTMAAK